MLRAHSLLREPHQPTKMPRSSSRSRSSASLRSVCAYCVGFVALTVLIFNYRSGSSLAQDEQLLVRGLRAGTEVLTHEQEHTAWRAQLGASAAKVAAMDARLQKLEAVVKRTLGVAAKASAEAQKLRGHIERHQEEHAAAKAQADAKEAAHEREHGALKTEQAALRAAAALAGAKEAAHELEHAALRNAADAAKAKDAAHEAEHAALRKVADTLGQQGQEKQPNGGAPGKETAAAAVAALKAGGPMEGPANNPAVHKAAAAAHAAAAAATTAEAAAGSAAVAGAGGSSSSSYEGVLAALQYWKRAPKLDVAANTALFPKSEGKYVTFGELFRRSHTT